MNALASVNWTQKLFQRPLFLSVAIFCAAFLLRTVAINRYITPDELIWVYRSVNFREAVAAGNWSDTLLAGHPGVLTMWLGALGMSVQLLVNPADQEIYQWITKLAYLTPDNMTAFQQMSALLTSGRLAVAALNSLGIVLVFWVARQLQGDLFSVLVLAILLLDPFLTGLSGILHVDGLATTFATLSLLLLALSLVHSAGDANGFSALIWAVFSGAAAALAVLSKSPAILLAPLAGLLFFLNLWRNQERPFSKRLQEVVFLGLIWLGSFITILFLVFPALWVGPLQVLQMTSSNATRHIEEALRPTFFLGNIAFDHGPLFYPIALAWRVGPIVMIGLIIFLGMLLRPKWRKQVPKVLTLVLSLWIVIFLVAITVTAKKFDRYALPVIPALGLLAAVSWNLWLRPGERAKRLLLSILLIVQLAYVIFVLPYPLSAYNLLLGGPLSAQYVLPIGWGESISGAGRWLSANLDVESKRAISGIAPSLAPFFKGDTLLGEEEGYEFADYVIFTANSYQVDPQGVAQRAAGMELLKTIRYGGLDQSWIYENPQPLRQALTLSDLTYPVRFGTRMQLLSQGIQESGNEVLFTARWDRQESNDPSLVKLNLVGGNGHKWSSLETALLNEVSFYPEDWRTDEKPTVTYELDLPAAIPPGRYSVELSLVDEATGSTLPVLAANGDFQGLSYHVGDLILTRLGGPVDMKSPDLKAAKDVAWSDGALQLLGHGKLPERVIAGGELNLDLYWQATDSLPDGVEVMLQVANEEPEYFPLSRFDSGLWPPGTVIQEKYRLQIPATLQAGNIDVVVRPVLAPGERGNSFSYTLGQVEIQTTDRLFTLPEEIGIPLIADFEPGIHLHGANAGDAVLAPGEIFRIVLFWQTDGPTDVPVNAFVHILNDQGEIVAQADRWPGGLPSNIWAPDQVIIDEYAIQLPLDTESGNYEIRVGLYEAESGRRLPVVDAAGQAYADESVPLPLTVTVKP